MGQGGYSSHRSPDEGAICKDTAVKQLNEVFNRTVKSALGHNIDVVNIYAYLNEVALRSAISFGSFSRCEESREIELDT
jgi:hypothetical protein